MENERPPEPRFSAEEAREATEGPEDLPASREIADTLTGLGDEYGFDAETCEEIAAQPFGEAFQTAYSYLTQAGLDADKILAPFIEETDEKR